MPTSTANPSVEEYDTDTLISYLQNQRILNLSEQHINVLREKEVAGYDFLRYKQEDLERYGLKPGPAKRILDFAVQLNSQKQPDADKRPRKRPRLVRVLDGDDVEQAYYNPQKIKFIEQVEWANKVFNDPDNSPIIIDNGQYSLGTSDFSTFINSGTFIDKSLFIMEFMIYGSQASLITRPRRFGKSTNLLMLHTFLSPTFSNQEKERKLELFQKLKIYKFEWFIKLYFGNWPVIYVSFKDLNDRTWDTMISTVKDRIKNLYEQHSYVLDSKVLSKDEENDFRKIKKGTKSKSHLINSLTSLARHLNTYFHVKPVILIDEYDWPMEHAGDFYEDANSFFRTMYSSVAKDNEYVYKILFVGLLQLGQANFLSGLNNVVAYPMHISPNKFGRALFSDAFGFTEMEVKFLLKEKKLSNKLQDLRLHYNGYKTSTHIHIFNPHSIMSYLSNHNIIKDYWINSGPSTTLVKYLKQCGPAIEELLNNVLSSYSPGSGISVNVKLQEVLRYDILEKEPKMDAIYTLLYYSGYLSIKNMKGDLAELVIPNEEVANQWRSWVFEIIGIEHVRTNEIYKSLFKKDIKKFCDQFPSLYLDMVSCYDIADLKRSKLYETWYHLFVLGTLAIFHGNDYHVLSNREFGEGRNDVCIIPLNKNKDTSIIFEFKLAKSDNCMEMKRSAKEGLDQIDDKNYRANIQNYVKAIVEVAVAFHKKSAFVSARLLKRKKDGLLTNDTWEEVESAESKYLQIQRDTVNNFLEDTKTPMELMLIYIHLNNLTNAK